jgi:hypothetical protein
MSDTSSQSAAEKAAAKVHEATERAKDGVEAAVHEAGQVIREGAARFKDSVANVKDAVSEQLHRGAAEVEHTRRDAAGDDLSASERLASIANEIKNNAQAEIDALKQRARKP